MKMMKLTLVIAAVVSAAASAMAQSPTVRAGDAVTVTIRGVPDQESARVSGVYKVDQSGELVGLPYLDGFRINAIGLTEGQLSKKIANAYRDAQVYTKATITALVDQPTQRTVTLGGKISKPGPVPYQEGMTIYEAVMAAGGPTRFGSLKKVTLHRKGVLSQFNIEKDENKTVTLLPGDTVEINDKSWNEL